MPHEKPMDIALWSGGHDVSGPLTLGFEAALVVSNVFPICFVCFLKRGRSRIATDELITALSITDILSVVVPGPLGWMAYFTHQWYGGKYTCQFYQVCVTWFQLTSMCLITFMTFDRWMSLKDALLYKSSPSSSNCRVRISVFLIYMFTLAVSCIPLTGLAPSGISSSGRLCQSWLLVQPGNPLEHVFHFVFLTVGFSNLLTTMLVNVTVMVTLWRFQKKFGSKQAERMSSAALQIDKRSVVEFTVMILIVTLVFYLAWLPTLMMLTVIQFGVQVPDAAMVYALLSTTLTGLLNPITYGVFSRVYRRGYYKLLTTISRLLCGCPVTQEDVLKKLPRGGYLRAAGSTNNSLAGLLSSSRASEAQDSDYSRPDSLAQSAQDALLGGGDGHPTFNSRCEYHARHHHQHHHCMGNHAEGMAGQMSISNANYEYDMPEQSGMDELLLEKDENDVCKEMSGSRLSLISEESEDHGDVTYDVTEGNPQNVTPGQSRRVNMPIVIQESMI